MSTKRFRVAFTFAGEKRDFVEKVADILAGQFGKAAILYDKYHEAEFAVARLGRYLPKLYREEAELIVAIFCKDYLQKEWTGLEWDAVFHLIRKRQESEVMLCRFNYVIIDELPDAGFVELDNKTPQQLANTILDRITVNECRKEDASETEKKHHATNLIVPSSGQDISAVHSQAISPKPLPQLEIRKLSFKTDCHVTSEIILGEGVLAIVANDLRAKYRGNRFFLISSQKAHQRFGHYFNDLVLDSNTYVFEANEKNKSLSQYEKIIQRLSEGGFYDRPVIIALGRGTVKDIAGYVAATYLRGVPFVIVPTSLLAQADASVGGKTSLHQGGTLNVIGAYKHASTVYIDPSTLSTLSDEDFAGGMAEIIKHAMMRDATLFDYLQSNASSLKSKDPQSLHYVVSKSFNLKADVIESDPEEKCQARMSNYGHTIGRAIESLTHFRVAHGQAVAIGMTVEGHLSTIWEQLSPEDLARQTDLLKGYGLPSRVPTELDDAAIIRGLRHDKWGARFVVPRRIGNTYAEDGRIYDHPAPADHILEAIRRSR